MRQTVMRERCACSLLLAAQRVVPENRDLREPASAASLQRGWGQSVKVMPTNCKSFSFHLRLWRDMFASRLLWFRGKLPR